ncbi:MAG TPA: cytochrome c oxidase subunit 4 [Micromonosporaceae bacterium]
MKTEWRIFGLSALVLYAAAGIYAYWVHLAWGEIEWIGVVSLTLAASLCAMCGGFFWFVSRRIEPRPEDREDAEVAEGAGEVGFFSPGSYWPFGLAVAAALTAIGLSYWLWWLIVGGLIAVTFAVCGLLFEYYTGTRRTAEH